MTRKWVYPGIALAVLAQPASPASTQKVEAAVRARAQEFLQLEVDKKFRQAEALMADESKDLYYNGTKPAIKSFKIDSVQVKDDKTVLVHIRASYLIVVLGAPPQIFELPSVQTWKREGGQWKNYIDPEALLQTPFGKLRSMSDNTPAAGPAFPSGLMASPGGGGVAFNKMLELDRHSVDLSASAPTQTVIVKNGLPGPVDIAVGQSSPHLTVDIEKPHLQPGEKSGITITWKDRVADTYHVRISVLPVGQQLEIDAVTK